MPAIELVNIEGYRAAIKGGAEGAILDPLPKIQLQEGPNCGFYALSIVMHYWKDKGSTTPALPARKRDAGASGTDTVSLRALGKKVGALDLENAPKASTGGVFTAEQLAAVAKAANFHVRVVTESNAEKFIAVLRTLIDKGFPPIVAFDVEKGDPVLAGGAHSHWGVIVGHVKDGGAQWLIATHGHGKYYKWIASDLQKSNFNLKGTTRKLQDEVKLRLGLKGGAENDPSLARLTRWGWFDAKGTRKVTDLAADPTSKVAKVEAKTKEIRRGSEVKQDLGCHIVCVAPKSN